MREFKINDDELYLKGRIQIETAIYALGFTALSPLSKNRLEKMLEAHQPMMETEADAGIIIYLRGDEVRQEKIDIIESLKVCENSQLVPEEYRLAARALIEII